MCGPRAVFDKWRKRYVVTGRIQKKVEAKLFAYRFEIDYDVAENKGEGSEYYRQCHDLDDDGPGFLVSPKACEQVACVRTGFGDCGHGEQCSPSRAQQDQKPKFYIFHGGDFLLLIRNALHRGEGNFK